MGAPKLEGVRQAAAVEPAPPAMDPCPNPEPAEEEAVDPIVPQFGVVALPIDVVAGAAEFWLAVGAAVDWPVR